MTTMTGGSNHAGKRFDYKQLFRIVFVTVAILMVPLVSMQFTREVNWTASDFLIMGGLLLSAGSLMQWTTNKVRSTKSRVIVLGAIAISLFFIWAELAVGLVDSPIAGS